MSFRRPGHQCCPANFDCLSSIIFRIVSAEKDGLPIELASGSPFVSCRIPSHPPVGGRPTSIRTVTTVTGMVRLSEVRASIVQAIAIPVIAFDAVPFMKTEQSAMEIDGFSATINRCASYGVPFAAQRPSPPIDPVSIVSINGGVGTDRAITATKRNEHSAIGRGIIRLHRMLLTSGARPVRCATTVRASLRQLYHHARRELMAEMGVA
jgi:hypothetical protein